MLYEFVLGVVGYTTARIVVPVLSFGQIKVQKISEPESDFKWSGIRRQTDGTLLLDANMAGWVGLFFWITVLIAIMVFVR